MARVRSHELQQYEKLILPLLSSAYPFVDADVAGAVRVEHGLVFPQLLAAGDQEGRERAASLLSELPAPTSPVRVIDAAGHSRPAYLGLLVFCFARAFASCRAISSDTTDRQRNLIRTWCDAAESDLMAFNWPLRGVPAARGADAASAAWCALALYAGGTVLGSRNRIDLAAHTLGRFAAAQISSGAFLVGGRSDNPEALWYHELVLLHAAASYAAQANDPLVTAAVMQAADFHVRETQPDHATTEPWGLLAFIWRREARSLADGMLHALKLRHPHGTGAISSMLLADCLYCLRLLAR